MQILQTSLAAFLILISALDVESQPTQIDLNAPNAIARLARSNPTQYEKVCKIIAVLGSKRFSDDVHWIQTDFHARAASYGTLLLTSYPPQRYLAFKLDDTQYHAHVTLEDTGGKIYPTRCP
jgi:hypothetical protein